jgi:uncharacterized lipoprotein NlpE involved in copper resistance
MKFLTLMAVVFALAACDKAQAPFDPLHATALQTCKGNIESRAVNPKTVTYLRSSVAPEAGKLVASITFSAKNEIGSGSTMVARCVTSADGKALVDIVVKMP